MIIVRFVCYINYRCDGGPCDIQFLQCDSDGGSFCMASFSYGERCKAVEYAHRLEMWCGSDPIHLRVYRPMAEDTDVCFRFGVGFRSALRERLYNARENVVGP